MYFDHENENQIELDYWLDLARIQAAKIYAYAGLVDDGLEHFTALYFDNKSPRDAVVEVGSDLDLITLDEWQRPYA